MTVKRIYNFFEKTCLKSLSDEKKLKLRVSMIKLFIFVRDNTVTYLKSWVFMMRYPRSDKNIFIACITRSASTYVERVLELGLPGAFKYFPQQTLQYHLTGKGLFPLRFRCTIQRVHMPATKANINILKSHGITKYVVMLRDPRDVLVSFYHEIELGRFSRNFICVAQEYYTFSQADKMTYLIRLFLPRLIDFINYWDNVTAEFEELKILPLYYRDMVNDPNTFFKSILDFYNIPERVFNKDAMTLRKGVRFRKGKVGTWREYFNGEHAALAEVICGDVLKKHGWESLSTNRVTR